MNIEVIGCYGGQAGRTMTQVAYRIGDSLLVDAGSAAMLPLEEQLKIDDILISHSHLDHIKDIGFIADNVVGQRAKPINIIGIPEAITAIRQHYFNNLIWPDFTTIPSREAPVLALKEMAIGAPLAVGEITVESFKAVHPVPAVGFMVSDGAASVVFSNDTGPNDLLWETVARTPNLKALFVECSFPNELQLIGDLSGHFTPASLGRGLQKIERRDLDVYICHMKPGTLSTLKRQLAGVNGHAINFLEGGEKIVI